MDPFQNCPDNILDLILLKLNQEDLHETLRVSKSWFWASIRRIKKLKIDWEDNLLKSMAEFYNNHRQLNEEEIVWSDLFKHLVLDELIVDGDDETTSYIIDNGCNVAVLKIKDLEDEETLMTLVSLERIIRLKSFEYCVCWGIEWHPFIVECLKSFDCEFDPNKECPIKGIKLNSSGWNSEDPVLHSVTNLRLSNVTIDVLSTIVRDCPNLEELHCFNGDITKDWQQVFPANVKRIELIYFNVDDDVATFVEASNNSARDLLPYLCQDWKSVEKFLFVGHFDSIGEVVYKAFPQQREEVFDCAFFDDDMELASSIFESREIRLECDGRKALELLIPPAKSVKLELHVEHGFRFSPGAVCCKPEKAEHLSVSLTYPELDKVERWILWLFSREFVTLEPFGPNSFERFSRLTSLALTHVSTVSIKMALDQCPSIIKLKLQELEAFTIRNIPRGLSYANVSKLVLVDCEEPVDKLFEVFPCLSKLKYFVCGKEEMQKKTTDWFKLVPFPLKFKNLLCGKDEMSQKTDWLCKHLVRKDKRYGVVFESLAEIRYLVSDDLQVSLSQAQKFLNRFFHSKCYLKGFKLIPRVATQKVVYIN